MYSGNGVAGSMRVPSFDGEAEGVVDEARTLWRGGRGVAESGDEPGAECWLLGRAPSASWLSFDDLDGMGLGGLEGERNSRRERGRSSWLVLSLYMANFRRRRSAAAFCDTR